MESLRLVILIIFVASLCETLKVCEKSPNWKLSNKSFPGSFSGKIKLVALLKANCRFCRTQSLRLGQLYKELIAEKYNVSFVIVNAHDSGNMDVFLKTNLTVLQDNSKINVWGMYNAKVDDMIIFDRCGHMINHLSLPDSLVHTGSVKNATLNAYNSRICSSKCADNRG